MLVNSPVVLPAQGITYRVSRIETDVAFSMLDDEGFISAVGHAGTVEVLKAIFPALAENITLNRVEIKEPSMQVVFKLKGRIPEGKVLSKAEIAQIGYEFWSILPIKERVAPRTAREAISSFSNDEIAAALKEREQDKDLPHANHGRRGTNSYIKHGVD